jgi:ribosome-binding factor A
MNVPGRRQARLADQVRAEAAEIIAFELKDPRIGFVTVTHVELTADLQHARVWVSVLGGAEARQATLEGLASAAGYLRREIGQRLRLRRSLEISFLLDRGAEASDRLEHLLRELHHEEGDS